MEYFVILYQKWVVITERDTAYLWKPNTEDDLDSIVMR